MQIVSKSNGRQGPEDTNETAFRIVQFLADKSEGRESDVQPECDDLSAKRAEAGRAGGLKGGRARAQKLSDSQRAEIARKAAKARWSKQPPGA